MENWNNLKDWQAWLNNISEPEWAAFMAQHGGEMDALRGAWGRFAKQRVLGQPENGVDDLSQRQPENDVKNSSQTQPENAVNNETKRQPESIRQPENTQTAVQQSQAVNNTEPSNQLAQPDNTISGCPTDADLPSANVPAEPTEQAASEVTTAAAPAQPSNQMPDQTQNVLQQPENVRQPENGVGNPPQTQPENAISNETKQPQIPPPPFQHPHPPIPMPTPHTLPPLPNARHGEPYHAALPPAVTAITFHPECGLVWDAKHHQISGTPSQAGDVEIHYHLADSNNTLTSVIQKIYINPNPKDLWQNKPSDPNAPFAKPDTAHDLIATAQGSLIAARVRGRSHAHNGTHCDDDYRIAHHERTGLHFIAVADGAGSAEFSRYGSQLAVNAAADTVWQLLDNNEKFFRLPESEPKDQKHALENLISNAAYQAYVAQKNAAEAEQIDIKKLACTLLIALALPRTDGTWLIAAYWVGDGAAAVWQPESQTITLLGESDGGAYSGETVFLSASEVSPENLSKRIRSWQGQQPPVLMLMTDGVSDPKFETDANLARPERWAELWQEGKFQTALQAEQPAAALEGWLDFWSPGNHDDRTLALFLPTKAA